MNILNIVFFLFVLVLLCIVVFVIGGMIVGVVFDVVSMVGYQVGVFGVSFLVDVVLVFVFVVCIDVEQVVSIDSKDFVLLLWNMFVVWIDVLMVDLVIDGIVIIYGIDMFEEIVYVLYLVVKGDKLVVLMVVMWLVIVLLFDGLLNLLNVVMVVVYLVVYGQGVLVVFNNWIYGVCDVVKMSIYVVDVFQLLEFGVFGWVQDGCVEFVCCVMCICDM